MGFDATDVANVDALQDAAVFAWYVDYARAHGARAAAARR